MRKSKLKFLYKFPNSLEIFYLYGLQKTLQFHKNWNKHKMLMFEFSKLTSN